MSESADRDDVEQLAEEFVTRHRRGERPTITEYADAHPKLAAEIRDLFPAILLAERLGAPLLQANPPTVPDRLGDFRIVRELGRGGMGVVYEAIQEPLGRHVALKVLPFAAQTNPTYRERFQREARAAAKLNHDNIVPVYGVGEHQGVLYYAMQFILGRGLDAVLREAQRQRGGAKTLMTADPTPQSNGVKNTSRSTTGSSVANDSSFARLGGQEYYRSVARIGLQVAEAMAYAHQHGILHRDIKPSNLLIDAHEKVWITDFGLAKSDEEDGITNTGDLVGTIRYMAPERFSAVSDIRSDVYGLGITLYELLTTRPAFCESDRPKLIEQVLHDTPPAPRKLDARIPRDLDTIVQKAMAKEPHDRYSSADQLADELRRYLHDQPIIARPTTWSERIWRWCRRNPILATLTSLVALLLLVILIGSPIMTVRLWEQRIQTVKELWTAQLARADAARSTNQAGRRFDGLAALDAAHQLVPTLKPSADQLLELRNQFIASTSYADLGISKRWDGYPLGSAGVGFDSDLQHYARSNMQGDITIRSVSDDSEIARLKGEGEAAWALRFSPDGRYLAAGYQPKYSKDAKKICVWDWKSGSILVETASRAYCSDSAFSADSKRVAFGQDNATLAIYDLTNPQTSPVTITLKAPTNSVAFHPDGTKIALAQIRSVELRDIATGKVLKSWIHEKGVACVSWRGDGRVLAVGNGRIISLWDLDSTQPGVLRGHEREVIEASFSRNGRLLASRGYDGTVRLWDVELRQQIVRTPNVHTGCSQLQFSPDDRLLGFASDGARLWLWNVAPGDECRKLQPRGVANWHSLSGHFILNGRLLIAGGNDGAHVWDCITGQDLGFLPVPEVWNCQWTKAGLLTASRLGVHRWPTDLSQSNQIRFGPPTKLFDRLAERVVAGDDASIVVIRDQKKDVHIRRSDSDASPITITDQPQILYSSMTPDSSRLATGTLHGRNVFIRDAKSGQRQHELPIPGSAAVTWTNDARHLIVATERQYSVWETSNWTKIAEVDKQLEDVPYAVSLTSDGNLLAVRHAPSLIRLYHTFTLQLLAELQLPQQQTMSWIELSDDGRRLAAANMIGEIYLWDLQSIRAQLARRGLDWEPSLPASEATSPAMTIQVKLDAELSVVRATEFLRQKDYDQALSIANQAVESNPHDAQAGHLLAYLYTFGPARIRAPNLALPLAKQAFEASSDRLDYRTTMAAAHFRLDQFQEAHDLLLPSLAKADGPMLFLMASIQSKLGNADAARAAYRNGLQWWRSRSNLASPLVDQIATLRGEAEGLLIPKPTP